MPTTEPSTLVSEKLPNDLRQWLGERCLVSLALEAVQAVNGRVLHGSDRGSDSKLRMMLTLLCYCYSAGILGSQHIEWAIQSDLMLRYICAGESPDWLTIRRFRRQHVELLCQGLAYLLKRVRALKTGAAAPSVVGWSESELDHEIAGAVRSRIDTAIVLDTATSDF